MAKESLAAKSGALESLKLPAVFQPSAQKPIEGRYIAPYITFCHPKRADEWNKINAKFQNVYEGEMFLVTQKEIYRLPELKCGWLSGLQYWAQTNPNGDVIATSLEELPRPFKEHVEAVVLVYLEDRICVPANVNFRTTKCGAAKVLSDALAECQTPDWSKKSPAHKESLIQQQPFCRFYGITALGPARTSKSTGMPYRPATCDIKPTAVPEWRLLTEYEKNPECQEELNDAARRYEDRVAEVKKKLQKAA